MKDPATFYTFLFLAIPLIVIILAISNAQSKRRSEARRDWANSMGYRWLSSPDEIGVFTMGTPLEESLVNDIADMYPLRYHHHKGMRIVQGVKNDYEFSLFDYIYRTGKASHACTIVAVTATKPLPTMKVRAKSAWTTLAKWFGSDALILDLSGTDRSLRVDTPTPNAACETLTDDVMWAIDRSIIPVWQTNARRVVGVQPGCANVEDLDPLISQAVELTKLLSRSK